MTIKHVFIALVVATSSVAHADKLLAVDGVELSVPDAWTVKTAAWGKEISANGNSPRWLEVFQLASMPAATPAALQGMEKQFHFAHPIKIEKTVERERAGAKLVVATAQLMNPKKPTEMDLLVVPVNGKAIMIASFVRTGVDDDLRKLNLNILDSVQLAGPKVVFQLKPTKTKGKGVSPLVVDWLKREAAALDRDFRFPRKLAIAVGDCGVVNAFYDRQQHAVILCHEFWDDVYKLFTGAKYSEADALKKTNNEVRFAFMHEVGHALVGELDLPITGRGEDAADEIATIFMAWRKDNDSRDMALAEAEYFDISQKKHTKVNFFDEHSIDAQRMVSIVCLLYGSDTKRYETLVKSLQIPDNRAAKCARDYPARSKAWMTLLAPHRRS